MGWWERTVVPRIVDAACGQHRLDRWRAAVCADLSGRVLEIGFGSGLNLPHLPAAVSGLDAVEPSDLAWMRSAGRRAAAGAVEIRRIGLDGQRIAGADATYDGVLITFALCTIPDPALAAREARRLVRPGGVVRVLEHGRAPDPGVLTWQRRLEPLQRRVAGGCHLTRDPVALLGGAGLVVDAVEAAYAVPGPGRPLSYLTAVRAHRGTDPPA
ncbi:methyltransferase domain-containing protein [Nocardioides fonticola]|uniref:Methyltransferase domain-containing protein n=1 Tax=Nocardioides fonticola TaxID=450363 RepID=A0ABP7XIU8_9ACTN